VNGPLPGGRSVVLNLHTPRGGGRLLRIGIDPPWAHVLVNKPFSKYPIDYKPGTLHRDQRRHDIAHCISIMVRHCRRDSLDPAAHHEVKFQESPYIQREDSRLEWSKTNESGADRIDPSRGHGPCLPRNPGQSPWIVLADMRAKDPSNFSSL